MGPPRPTAHLAGFSLPKTLSYGPGRLGGEDRPREELPASQLDDGGPRELRDAGRLRGGGLRPNKKSKERALLHRCSPRPHALSRHQWCFDKVLNRRIFDEVYQTRYQIRSFVSTTGIPWTYTPFSNRITDPSESRSTMETSRAWFSGIGSGTS
jgi:hypothetical protein